MYSKIKFLAISLLVLIICSSAVIIICFFIDNSEISDFFKHDTDDTNENASTDSKIGVMLNMVNKNMVYNYLAELVDIGVKPTRSENCDQAAAYIYNRFSEMGLDVEYQNWRFPLIKGKNVIATHTGNNPESDAVFIVCAHYDTWRNTVGANDDASGIAAMLSVAEVMSNYSFNHTMRFIGLSGHESGPFYTYGSTAYVRCAYKADDNIVGVLNLDMIGNTTREGNAIQLHGPQRSEWLIDYINEINDYYAGIFEVSIENFQGKPGGDESSFITYGYDAVLFIQANFWELPNHVPEDDLSTIDFDYLTNVTKLILACAGHLAEYDIRLQVRITKPREDYVYVFDRAWFSLPGLVNLKRHGLRSMTYIIGGITVELDIDTDDEVKNVYFTIDDVFSYKNVVSEPPYEFTIEKRRGVKKLISGKHTLGVKVFTYTGLTACDEIDVLFIP